MTISSLVRSLSKERHIAPLQALQRLTASFSLAERIVFYSFSILLAVSAFSLLARVHESFLVEIPRQGGSLTEGVIGSPRFINPTLAVTDADRDLVSLIFAGLLRAGPDGTLVPELAESYETQDEGKSYVFTLRDDIRFHDGTPVTADDVVFTIETVQNPNLKSPKWANWTDVTVEKIDDRHVRLAPKGPYGPFLQNVTLGILPKHIWKNISAEQFPFAPENIEPVGAGSYKVDGITRGKSGVPSAFSLVPFDNYVLGAPYIASLTLRFYPNEEDLFAAHENGEVESLGSVSPRTATLLKEAGARVEHAPLLRVFGVFFNQNRARVLANKEVRQALEMVADRERIVSEILAGYANTVERPVPPGLLPEREPAPATTTQARISAARALLKKNGWSLSTTTNILEKTVKKQPTQLLELSLATPNSPELKAVADIVAQNWRSIGAKVEVNVFEAGDLHQNVIRPRKFDALLFGEIVGRDLDLYPFWHSSQRNDPGYNISQYANLSVDTLMEDARKISDNEARIKKYLAAEDEIRKDIPAVFLYAPDFIYIVPPKVENFAIGHIAVPAERFADIANWYIETDRVWVPLAEKITRDRR